MSVSVFTRVRPLFDVTEDLFRASPSMGRRSLSARGRSPESYDMTRRHQLALESGACCMQVNRNEIVVHPIQRQEKVGTARGRPKQSNRLHQRAVTPRGTRSSGLQNQQQNHQPYGRMVSTQSAVSKSSTQNEDGETFFRGRLTEPTKFSFDTCFSSDKGHPEYASQKEVYMAIGRPSLKEFISGFNTCIMAYGQTGSGKTYTMLGPHWDEIRQVWSPEREREKQRKRHLMQALASSTQRGLMMRMCSDLFRQLDEIKKDTKEYAEANFKILVSYYQIYQEKVTCLLEPEQGQLKVRLDHKGNSLPKLPTRDVRSFSEMMDVLEHGTRNRKQDATLHNEHSSRSHAIFTIRLDSTLKRHGQRAECLSRSMNLVDLAGSEQLGGTQGISKNRQHETVKINSSLSALSRVMNALANKTPGGTTHVPYRESTLTWLLKDSLGGNSKTYLLATIAPEPRYQSESLSTLRYACKARRIVNKPTKTVNVETSLVELSKEADGLRQQLMQANNGESMRRIQAELESCQREMMQVKEEQEKRIYEMEGILQEKDDEIHHLRAQLETQSNGINSARGSLQLNGAFRGTRTPSPGAEHHQDFEVELHRGRFDTPWVKTSHHSKPYPKGLSSSPLHVERQPSTSLPPMSPVFPDNGDAPQVQETRTFASSVNNKSVRFSTTTTPRSDVDDAAPQPAPASPSSPVAASGFPLTKEEGQNWLQIFFDQNPHAKMTQHLTTRCEQFDFVPPPTVIYPLGHQPVRTPHATPRDEVPMMVTTPRGQGMESKRQQQQPQQQPQQHSVASTSTPSHQQTEHRIPVLQHTRTPPRSPAQVGAPSSSPQMQQQSSYQQPPPQYLPQHQQPQSQNQPPIGLRLTPRQSPSKDLTQNERKTRLEQWKAQLEQEKQNLAQADAKRRATIQYRREHSSSALTPTEVSPAGTTTSSEPRSDDTRAAAIVPKLQIGALSANTNKRVFRASSTNAPRGPSTGSSTCSSTAPASRLTQLNYRDPLASTTSSMNSAMTGSTRNSPVAVPPRKAGRQRVLPNEIQRFPLH